MAYIIKNHVNKILKSVKINDTGVNGTIYKTEIPYFNNYEIKELLIIQELLRTKGLFLDKHISSIETPDSHRFVFEGQPPAFHTKLDCPILDTDYTSTNYFIPDEVKNKDHEYIQRYRSWFKENRFRKWQPGEQEKAYFDLWGVKKIPNSFNFVVNSSDSIDSSNISDLEEGIDTLIQEIADYCESSQKVSQIVKRFSKARFLAYGKKELINNNTGFSESEVKEVLLHLDKNLIEPLKNLLFAYYRVKFNPDLEVDEEFIRKIGFRECKVCNTFVVLENVTIVELLPTQ
jgi:hypothetical protein